MTEVEIIEFWENNETVIFENATIECADWLLINHDDGMWKLKHRAGLDWTPPQEYVTGSPLAIYQRITTMKPKPEKKTMHYNVMLTQAIRTTGIIPVVASSEDEAIEIVKNQWRGVSRNDLIRRETRYEDMEVLGCSAPIPGFTLRNSVHNTESVVSSLWGSSPAVAWKTLKNSSGFIPSIEEHRISQELCGRIGCACGIVTDIV